MNATLLIKLKDSIKSGSFPMKYELFGGAGLIVSDKKNDDLPGKVCVITIYANQLSWLVFQLAEVFSDEIDYFNKYEFYPTLGDSANEGLTNKESLNEIMDRMIHSAETWYDNHFSK